MIPLNDDLGLTALPHEQPPKTETALTTTVTNCYQ